MTPALRTGAACDGLGCMSRACATGATVALVTDAGAFEEDCRRAAVVATKLAAPAWCRPALLIDKTVLAAQGATAVWVTGQGLVAAGRPQPARAAALDAEGRPERRKPAARHRPARRPPRNLPRSSSPAPLPKG
jgi:competence protein ComEC